VTSFWGGGGCETIGTAATPGLCQPRVKVKMFVESRWNVDWQGKPKFSEKTCPSATFVHHKIPHAFVTSLATINTSNRNMFYGVRKLFYKLPRFTCRMFKILHVCIHFYKIFDLLLCIYVRYERYPATEMYCNI
jgi:hypothetical protein